MKPTDSQYRETAEALLRIAWVGLEREDGNAETDPHGQVQRVQEGGAWVSCFVFVPDELVEKLEASKP